MVRSVLSSALTYLIIMINVGAMIIKVLTFSLASIILHFILAARSNQVASDISSS